MGHHFHQVLVAFSFTDLTRKTALLTALLPFEGLACFVAFLCLSRL
jgi:hypothetical protein